MDYILIKGIPAFEAGHLHNFLDGIVLGCIDVNFGMKLVKSASLSW